jgi:hypothetical protein
MVNNSSPIGNASDFLLQVQVGNRLSYITPSNEFNTTTRRCLNNNHCHSILSSITSLEIISKCRPNSVIKL